MASAGGKTANGNANKRRDRDLMKLMMSDFPVELGNSVNEFHVKFRGPKDSPYAGGVWRIRVTIPKEYPFKSPSVGFVNRILHPNVDEASGSVCLDVINQTWSPMYDLVNIFSTFLPQLLLYPNPSDPLNGAAASLLLRDAKAYETKVKEHVQRYASEDFALETDQAALKGMKPPTTPARPLPNALVRTPGSSSSSSSSGPSTPLLAPASSSAPPSFSSFASSPIPIGSGSSSAAAAARSNGSSVASSSSSSSSLPPFSLDSNGSTESSGALVARLSVSVPSSSSFPSSFKDSGKRAMADEEEEVTLDAEALERLKELDRVVAMQEEGDGAEELSDMDELPDPAASPLAIEGADETFFY